MLKLPVPLLAMLSATLTVVSVSPARASVIYGSLSNFDAINDTGSTAHGFEIELDNCLPSNVYATFGGPYNRYGDPIITTDGVNTFIRYGSTYSNGVWATGTNSGTYAPTDGHSLFYPLYGGSLDYPNVPGDHFGVATDVTPSNTIYHWLLDDGNGNLVLAGTTVKVPTPILSIVAPVNPVNPAAVQAVIQAPAPENGREFGDAIWAKVFTTEVEVQDPVDLNDLVLGNPIVPPDSETEIEWHLLQADINNPGGGEFADAKDVGNPNESVTRRYEFYTYTGLYDTETHEALFDVYDPANVGDYLGNQNVAANFAFNVGAVPEPSTLVLGGLGAIGMAFSALRRRRPAKPTA